MDDISDTACVIDEASQADLLPAMDEELREKISVAVRLANNAGLLEMLVELTEAEEAIRIMIAADMLLLIIELGHRKSIHFRDMLEVLNREWALPPESCLDRPSHGSHS